MSISNRAAPRSKGTCARTLRTVFWDKRRLNFELIKSLTCKVVIFTVQVMHGAMSISPRLSNLYKLDSLHSIVI